MTLTAKNGEETQLGVTDADGKLVAQAGVGTYTLRIERKDCKPAHIAGVIIRNGERFTQSMTLEGAPSSLILTGTPAGANVSIDGEDAGTTPVTLENRKPGKELTLVFTKENYRPVTRKVVLDAGERKTVDYGPMIASHGAFDFTVRLSGRIPRPDELDGLSIARSDDGLRARDWTAAQRLPKEVPVGSYLITVTHPDYEPFQSAFTISDAETTRLDINLRALPARFELTGIPDNLRYALSLNNRQYATPPREIPAGVPLHLEIVARDYETFTRDFTARPRRDFKIDVKLKKIGPPVAGSAFVIPYLNTRLMWIPAGETRLGGTTGDPGHTAVEEPTTWAKFTKGFWIGRTEVTQAEYELILDSNPSAFRGARRPVENVTHADAMRYCKVLTQREYTAGRLRTAMNTACRTNSNGNTPAAPARERPSHSAPRRPRPKATSPVPTRRRDRNPRSPTAGRARSVLILKTPTVSSTCTATSANGCSNRTRITCRAAGKRTTGPDRTMRPTTATSSSRAAARGRRRRRRRAPPSGRRKASTAPPSPTTSVSASC